MAQLPSLVRFYSNRSLLPFSPQFNYIRTMTGHNVSTPLELPHPDREDLVLTDVLFALSDPARLEIVLQIADGALDMANCHLSNPTVPKSTKSHHMKVLREAGVIRNAPAGRGRVLTLRMQDLEAKFPGLMQVVLAKQG